MKDYIIIFAVIAICIIIIALRFRNAYLEEERKKNERRNKLR